MKHYKIDSACSGFKLNAQRSMATKSAQVSRLRPNTSGVTHVAVETLREFAKRRDVPASLNEVSSSKHVLLALYDMKKCEFIQEQKGDDAVIQILRSIPMAYQVDVLVQKYKDGGYQYPTSQVIYNIMDEMEEEAIFGPSTDSIK